MCYLKICVVSCVYVCGIIYNLLCFLCFVYWVFNRWILNIQCRQTPGGDFVCQPTVSSTNSYHFMRDFFFWIIFHKYVQVYQTQKRETVFISIPFTCRDQLFAALVRCPLAYREFLIRKGNEKRAGRKNSRKGGKNHQDDDVIEGEKSTDDKVSIARFTNASKNSRRVITKLAENSKKTSSSFFLRFDFSSFLFPNRNFISCVLHRI